MVSNRKRFVYKPGEWNYIFFMSDIHFGNAQCDEEQFIEDLEEAKKLNARIIIVGDLFDAIFSGDPRFKSSIPAPWIAGRDDATNKVIVKLEEILTPYADLIDLISLGNHEEAYLKYKSFDMISALLHSLNKNLPTNNQILHGSYIGYLQYVANSKNVKNSGGGHIDIMNVLYYHGKGGGAEITKGVMDFQRMKSKFVYDVFACGHNHFHIVESDCRIGITAGGKLKEYMMKNIRCGTYQKSYALNDPSSVPFSEKMAFTPVDIGKTQLRFRFIGPNESKRLEMRCEI